MSDEGFLSRWSRRKSEVDRAKLRTARAKEGATDSLKAAEATPELSAEEIARLPLVEDLTAASDLTQFLRAGVPIALRNAALRRIWALDPGMRDLVGEARDYGYDWNTPEGVPGSGPLLASDNVEALLRRAIGHSPEKAPDEQPARREQEVCETPPGAASQEPASDPTPAA